MDCNKDEALRAVEIAEKKFAANDFAGAKRFATKANNLYPGLHGVSQLLTTIDVYAAAEVMIGGEADWYGVLGVDPGVDDETLKRKYKKMALMLHPDKNNSVRADGAFKLLSEAWKKLSDKGDRAAYDQRRKAKAFHTAPTSGAGTAAQAGVYGVNKSAKGGSVSGTCGSSKSAKGGSAGPSASDKSTNGGSTTSKASGSNKSAKRGCSTKAATSNAGSSKPPAGPSSTSARVVDTRPQTFWTACYRCKIRYEYLRLYLNHNILCPCCHQPFAGRETPPPSFDSKPLASWKFPQQQQNSSYGKTDKSPINNGTTEHRSSSHNYTCYQWDPVNRTFLAKVTQQPNERVKREREETEAGRKREEALRRKV